jgi:DNA-binding transcriptional ArsR family regulator
MPPLARICTRRYVADAERSHADEGDVGIGLIVYPCASLGPHSENPVEALAAANLGAVRGGDLTDTPRVLDVLARDHSEEARAYHLALEAAAWLLRPAHFGCPGQAELRAALSFGPAARRIAALALAELERAALLSFAPAQLAAHVALHEQLVRDTGMARGEPELWLDGARGWLSLCRGPAPDFDESAARLQREALSLRVAPLVIELSAQRALAAELRGDSALSIEMARRASLMARTEALPQLEYLAHLVLARERRVHGRGHLAIRILSALERTAAPAFRGWLAWELAFAGDLAESERVAASSLQGSAPAPVAALRALKVAAVGADRAGLARAGSALQEAARDVAFIARETTLLLEALDPAARPRDSELARWCSGEQNLPPAPILSLCGRAAGSPSEGDDLSEAYVLWARDGSTRRVLGLSLTLLDSTDIVRLRRSRRHQGRVETLVAVLALGGPPGLPIARAFELTYGFAYEADLHRGVLEVLLHRVRAYLGDAAELLRSESGLRLLPASALLVPDPRCAAPEFDRLLRILAREGRVSANQAAQQLGLSLRAVQQALKTLTEEGACASYKDGRHVFYIVEDTTFSEATERLARPGREP